MLSLVVLFLILLSNRAWFSPGTLSSGDWPYLFLENIKEFSFVPDPHFFWLGAYYQIPTKVMVEYFHIPWELTEKIFWFWPFLLLSIASSYYLTKSWLGVLIYTTNTYILMIVGGGQMGIAMAYSIAPFVLRRFLHSIKSFPKYAFKTSVLTGLLLSVLTMFDPRIAYITFLAVTIYFLLVFRNSILSRKGVVYLASIIILPLAIAGILNSYWIIPILNGNLPKEYQGIISAAGFKFLSFTDFSHSFSLLHPNWPENIFGKTYFLKPEFLALPILAYSSLLFINSKSIHSTSLGQNSKLQVKSQNFSNLTIEQFNNRTILFFALLGLLGAFLAKGMNEPFGQVNQFLFEYVPGMNMFRDPTKFYLLIALSYSVLIPFSINSIQGWIHSKLKSQNSKLEFKIQKYGNNLASLLFIFYFLLLIRTAILGNLSGTFSPQPVPEEYIALKNFLHEDKNYFKTLWIPTVQRFGFHSKVHPALAAGRFFDQASLSGVLAKLDENVDELPNEQIKYLIIPHDSRRELFLKDRKYDEDQKKSTIEHLKNMPGLIRLDGFGKIAVFTFK